MSNTQPMWTDFAVTVTAVIAIILSVVSLFYARASLALAKEQDRRREPKLVPEFLQGHYTIDCETGSRTYHIQLSVRNTSDSDNALARIEFRITYRASGEAETTIRIQASKSESGEHFPIPMRIAAHETMAGWCHFLVVPEAFRGNQIELYDVEIADTHGQSISVTPLLLSERRNVQ